MDQRLSWNPYSGLRAGWGLKSTDDGIILPEEKVQGKDLTSNFKTFEAQYFSGPAKIEEKISRNFKKKFQGISRRCGHPESDKPNVRTKIKD